MESLADARHFFILGAMKCGTTTLYALLERHPDICISQPKEPVFFEAQFERGLDFYRDTYFRHWNGEARVGDAQARHLGLGFVAERIHACFPEAQLIAILRDPVERAFSEWWHRTSRGRERKSFREALDENRERLAAGVRFDGPDAAALWRKGLRSERAAATRYGLYLDLGYYAEQLERYRRLFPERQLRVLLLEDLRADPLAVLRELCAFLEVDPDRAPELPAVHNPARESVDSPLQAHLAFLRLPQWLRRLVPDAARGPWRALLRGRPASRPPMDADTEARLLEHFAPHNRALERLLSRELPAWFRPDARRRGEA